MGAWRIMGRKGYVRRRERKDWELAMGVLKGRGGEKYGELYNNTQYFVIEKRVGGGSQEKGQGVGRFGSPILKISDYE